jgi:hypothetical protein
MHVIRAEQGIETGAFPLAHERRLTHTESR